MTSQGKPELAEELSRAEKDLSQCRKKVTALRRQLPPEQVGEYTFKTTEGRAVSLSELFGDKDDLIVIHNMGKKCPYCTLWADGFNGVYQHFQNRAGFVVVSPDPPASVREFAEGRGWKFRIVSNDGGPFSRDMGYENERGDPGPGVSTFHRDEKGTIRRVTHAPFGPGDDFCAVWHIFDLLKDGDGGWQPKYHY